MKTKNNISVMLSSAKNLWHSAAPSDGSRSFPSFRMTIMLAAVMALAACTNDDIPPTSATDALAAMNPETRIGISAEMEGELTASRNTTTEAVYAVGEIHEGSSMKFKLYLPGGSSATKKETSTATTLDGLTTAFPLYLKDFNLTADGTRCVSRWTQLEAYTDNDYLIGATRLENSEGVPTLAFGELKHARAKVSVIVTTDGSTPIANSEHITAKLNLQKSKVDYFVQSNNQLCRLINVAENNTTGATADVAAGDLQLLAYRLAADEPIETALGATDNGVSPNFTAIVRATPFYTMSDDGVLTALQEAAFADTDEITITVEDDYSGLVDNQVGGTYKLKFADIVMADNSKLTHLAPGDHLTVTVTLSHNSVASATATLGSWTEVGAEGGAATGGDDASKHIYTINAAEMTAEALQAAVTNALNAGVRELSIEGNLAAEQLVAVGTAIGAFEESKTGTNAGTVSLTMPDQTTIPASATVDNTGAFEDCYALKRVSMPALSEIIGDRAFYNCSALTEITLADGAVIGQFAFAECSTLATVNGTLSGTIGESAFFNCTALTEITLAEGTKIGEYAFAVCSNLTTVNGTLSGTIGNYAFYGCTLTAITLGDGAVIGNNAFAYCSKLATVKGKVSGTIGNSAFQDCSALTKITLADGVSIGDNAFRYCSNLTIVRGTLSGTIGNYAFYGCTSLTEITLGGDVAEIGSEAFRNCTGMTSLTLEGVVTSVGAGAFDNVGNGYCYLTLASGQEDVSGLAPDVENKTWAGNTWRSIYINTNE